MRAPAAFYAPRPTARDYFSGLDALRMCADSAVTNARRKPDRKFAESMLDRVKRFGMRTYMTSLQASRMTRLANTVPPSAPAMVADQQEAVRL